MAIKNTACFIPANIKPTDKQIAIELCRSKTLLVEANAGAATTTSLALIVGKALARGRERIEIRGFGSFSINHPAAQDREKSEVRGESAGAKKSCVALQGGEGNEGKG